MKYIIDLDPSRCISCGACAVACMDQNDTDVRGGEAPFRTILAQEEVTESGVAFQNLSVACMHCDDAPCIKGCPAGCLSKDPETGFTVLDNTNCIGCHSCSMACPFGAPTFNSKGKMAKCDGCAQRVALGMLPACVRVCPFDALKLYTEEEYEAAKRANSLHRIAKLLIEE